MSVGRQTPQRFESSRGACAIVRAGTSESSGKEAERREGASRTRILTAPAAAAARTKRQPQDKCQPSAKPHALFRQEQSPLAVKAR